MSNFVNLNSAYRCTRKRISRRLLTPGCFFSFGPIRKDAHLMHFVRKVIIVDHLNGEIIDHFGMSIPICGPDVYICVPR